jgi:hypothetical protein
MCDPQTATASSAANRLAIEATQRRQEALSTLDNVGQIDTGAIPADPIDDELGLAAGLLRRDMASSVTMLATATPGEVMESPPMHLVLEKAGTLPQVEALKNVVAGQNPSGVQLPPALARDLANEESLINAYFAATRVELDRVCLEKPVAGNDPFRVPARPAKPAAKPAPKWKKGKP